ncbi:smf1p [Saccharomyces arboricola H-6]|uniref:Smf1p n=1 Tax=Saccharomyces arboricola (strain H-6 / AS 2.3317 / CBS 10644) TaxID=1160507 RepID=J8PI79_SACAR|nr:smf1p [Saccharomyces arboricola H-6]
MVKVGSSNAAVDVGVSEAHQRNHASEEVFELKDKKDMTVVFEDDNPVRTFTANSSDHEGEDAHFSRRQVMRDIFSKYLKFIGPGLMVSVAYIDPGNYSTAVDAGAANQYSLLCIILLSNFIAIFLQCLCIKLGSVTGLDLSRACREYLPRWLNWTLYFFAECAVISTDIAEVIGTAIALNVLIKVPLPAGVAITVVDVFIIMFTYKPGASSIRFIRIFECFVAVLVVGVCICFAVELAYIPKTTSVRQVFRGFVPSSQMFEHNGIYTAISILGATVMPHSLFLGSALVQPRLLDYDVKHGNYTVLNDSDKKNEAKSTEEVMEEKYFNYRPTNSAIKYCMKYSMIELSITLFTLALFVNCAILVVAGSTLYDSSEADGADLFTIHELLSRNLAPAAGTIFMLALLLSGQSAGIVCTMAGQIVSEGHINWKLQPWQRRMATRCISIIPCLIISICIGREALSKALNASQVVLSIVLPFLVAPLIFFTCKKSIMKTEITVDQTKDNQSDHNSISHGAASETADNANSVVGQADASDMELENGKEVKTINMANNWVTTVIGILVWIFLSLLNVYAIVQLGMSHGDVS